MTTDINIFDITLHYLGKNKYNPFVVIIGAMDGISFDETRGYIDVYNLSGLFVEPIKEQFDRLVSSYAHSKNCKFENSAITDSNKKIEMLQIDSSVIDSGIVHPCFGGMSAIFPPRNGLASEGDKKVVEKYGKLVSVNGITLETLFKKHQIENFDILSIDTEGHDWIILKQLNLKKYKPKLIRIEYINLTEEEKIEVKKYFEDNNYIYRVEGQNIDAVAVEFFNSIKDVETKPIIKQKSNITIVTGIWDLGRDNAGTGFKRPFSHYVDKFKELLVSLKDYNLVVYIEEKHKDVVTSIRSLSNTVIRIKEIDEFKTLFPFYDNVKKIRTDSNWFGQAEWLQNSTQATLDLYNPMVMSKMFMLHDEKIRNPFNNEYFYWLDGGITNTVHPGYFYKDDVLKNVNSFTNKFLFVSFPYETGNEIHGFNRLEMNKLASTDNIKYVCRGGFFGGHSKVISEVNSIYYHTLSNTLSSGLMGTEESIFTILTYTNPELFDVYSIEENGLLSHFFEQLKTSKTIKISSDVNLYVLTYNSPKQFEMLCESYNRHNGFLKNTKNYLINNSIDVSTTQEYLNICKKYNFTHIKKDNLGICGGRQFAAEHFESTDAKYYIFLEDDMNLCDISIDVCKNGFFRYSPNLFFKLIKIMDIENYDFLKFSYTEFFGDNGTQWSWYNVPQHVREKYWPEKNILPQHGIDPNAPKTKFNNVKTIDGLSYIDGEIYYCNWPQIVSRNGNTKMFLDTTWNRPFEQTWMSHIYQLGKEEKIKSAVLLLSPINHHRFDFYDAEERKES